MNPLSDHPLTLLIFVDSLEKRSSLLFLSLLQAREGTISYLNIHPVLFSDMPAHDLAFLNPSCLCIWPVFADEDREISSHFSCLRQKKVFGRIQTVFTGALLLCSQEDILLETRCLNEKGLQRILQKALQVQYGWLKNHL